jgi:pimeloyl-ACP methyl ester carboxylesterase
MDDRPSTDPGTDLKEAYVEVSDRVALRVIDFHPPHDSPTKPAVLFVPGWISLVRGWQDVLKRLTPCYRTLYVETREKRSARIPKRGGVDFSISRMTQDIHEVWRQRVAPERPLCLVGSSLGSTIILDYLSQGLGEPALALLIAPNTEFRFPSWSIPIIRLLPASLYNLAKPAIKWYLREIRLDKVREPEQVAKYEGTLDAAEPKRLKANALALGHYSLWPKLQKVKAPVVIIGARSDVLHGLDTMKRMVALIPDARLVVMASNKETHSEKAGDFMVDQIGRLESSLVHRRHENRFINDTPFPGGRS